MRSDLAHPLVLAVVLGPLAAIGGPAARPDYDAAAADSRKLLAAVVAADTSNPPGNEARAVAAGAARLKEAGIPFERFEFAPGRENLVARLKGDGSQRPLLLLAHVDVVGTQGQRWSTPPHQLTEVNGFLQARGVADDLGRAAVTLETFILLAKSGVKLRRDVILAWTGDEESGGDGIRWLLKHHPEKVSAELAINEGGGVVLDASGKPKLISLNAAEKTYQDFTITARGTTGHSSVPLADNAILRLARGLERLGRAPFPPRLLPVTRAWFLARAPVESPSLGAAMKAAAE
ncbi:MAG TPA: M20/M25/M40 family metallo-hydrolase, partial [Myxococcaceae bacterium]|nr:M20/M25/M40 family metallo-hydrolase [Myxococcaceae bacterium]